MNDFHGYIVKYIVFVQKLFILNILLNDFHHILTYEKYLKLSISENHSELSMECSATLAIARGNAPWIRGVVRQTNSRSVGSWVQGYLKKVSFFVLGEF